MFTTMFDMDAELQNLPEFLKSDPECLYLDKRLCCHGANTVRAHKCGTYCTVSAAKWLKEKHAHLSSEKHERLIHKIAAL